jgi:hypothetical protein
MSQWNKPTLTLNHQCECGATWDTPVFSMCDQCILVFYFDNPNASVYGDDNE